ncbi:hypothetical protein ABAC402_17950 [Asticcacaulis sp. AC402]|nr:hypothetical protein ABAC402_17950 [Asticcacaulis sp. AC402]
MMPKGGPGHRAAGTAFVIAMLCISASGTWIAWHMPNMMTVIVGVLTFYLVATAWVTVKRKTPFVGLFDVVAALVAAWVAVAALVIGLKVANGQMQEYAKDYAIPAGVYFFWGGMSFLAASLDVSVMVRRGAFGHHRIARHLWRMCLALYIAASSFFEGQAQVFPEAVRATALLSLPALLVLAAMLFWLFRVLANKAFGKAKA